MSLPPPRGSGSLSPGCPVSDKCPRCVTTSLLHLVVSQRSYATRERACAICQIEWTTVDYGFGEYLKQVRPLQVRTTVPTISTAASGTAWTAAGQTVTMSFNVVGASAVAFEPPHVPEEPSGPGEDLPALPSSVIGYRAWSIDEQTLLLRGTGGYGDAWQTGVNEATCKMGHQHVSPALHCTCGLYALARFDPKTRWWTCDHVRGAVEAWADPHPENRDAFFLHPDPGFRAQYAKIVLLATSPYFSKAKNDFVRKVLGPMYEADVCDEGHLEDAAKEHGNLVPDELVEWARRAERSPKGANALLVKGLREPRGEKSAEHPSGFTVPRHYFPSPKRALLAKQARDERLLQAKNDALGKHVVDALNAYERVGHNRPGGTWSGLTPDSFKQTKRRRTP